MMTASVSDADILVLASLCWDEDTKTKVAQKLARELPNSCLVVDYASDSFSPGRLHSTAVSTDKEPRLTETLDKVLFEYLSLTYPRSPLRNIEPAGVLSSMRTTPVTRAFQLVEILSGKTSWSGDQNLYLYTCTTLAVENK